MSTHFEYVFVKLITSIDLQSTVIIIKLTFRLLQYITRQNIIKVPIVYHIANCTRERERESEREH